MKKDYKFILKNLKDLYSLLYIHHLISKDLWVALKKLADIVKSLSEEVEKLKERKASEDTES